MPEPSSRLNIAKRLVGGVTVLALQGEVRLEDGDVVLRRYLDDLIGAGDRRIVIDLGGVTAIDSSGMGLMAAKLTALRARGGNIKLVHLTSRSQKLLAVMKLTSMFETYEDEDEAIKSFN